MAVAFLGLWQADDVLDAETFHCFAPAELCGLQSSLERRRDDKFDLAGKLADLRG
jgi:hypothetical protein